MPHKVLITGPVIAEEATARLRAAGAEYSFAPDYSDMPRLLRQHRPDALILRHGSVGAEAFDAWPGLRIVAKHGAGTDTIDIAAATARGIVITNTPGQNARAVAEMTIALILASAKQLPRLDANLRAGQWEKPAFRGLDIAGQRLGLVGFGAIGRLVARFAVALGMHVAFYDPVAIADDDTIERIHDLDDLLAVSDIVSLHCPLTEVSRGLFDAVRIARMKPGAIFVNAARGELVDEAALLDALNSGHLGAAALDCFDPEPPATDHPLWSLANVIVTPHVGGLTHGAFRTMGLTVADCVLGVLTGSDYPKHFVRNPEVLKPA